MPRAGGVYSAPPGTTATPNTTVASAPYNALVADLVTDANAARPVTAGGTGATSAYGANDAFNNQGADIASAATTNLAAATGVYVNITGTVTITAFGTLAAGVERETTFTGILTLTHNATSLILPTAANIVTAAGDVARWRSLGGGNWKCVDYLRASGLPINANLNAPTITGPMTITGAAAATMLTVTSTDAGATGGPNAVLLRDSVSPAINDLLAFLRWDGRDSIAAQQTYAQIYAQIIDPVSGSEDGNLLFETVVAGVIAGRLAIGAGIYTPGATGGDKGADTFNATAFYANGARLGGTADVILEEQQTSGTNGGTFTTGSWVTRVLNTESRDVSGLCTLAGNAFTFTVSGQVKWRAPALHVDRHQTRLFNVTDTAVVKSGSTASTDSGNFAQCDSIGWALVTAGKQYRLEHQCSTTRASDGFGRAASFGETELYSQVEFWRTA